MLCYNHWSQSWGPKVHGAPNLVIGGLCPPTRPPASLPMHVELLKCNKTCQILLGELTVLPKPITGGKGAGCPLSSKTPLPLSAF